MYADDTALCFSHNDFCTIESNMNRDLKLVYDWSVNNKLPINATKTKCIAIILWKLTLFDLILHDFYL